mmetsp:Transcript_36653/g.59766  ORF Transcript_36653/g.59766 Transcript_36653/m.59766 type:complete len:206 (+) Transcript_36653:370-987(+)
MCHSAILASVVPVPQSRNRLCFMIHLIGPGPFWSRLTRRLLVASLLLTLVAWTPMAPRPPPAVHARMPWRRAIPHESRMSPGCFRRLCQHRLGCPPSRPLTRPMASCSAPGSGYGSFFHFPPPICLDGLSPPSQTEPMEGGCVNSTLARNVCQLSECLTLLEGIAAPAKTHCCWVISTKNATNFSTSIGGLPVSGDASASSVYSV